MKTSQPLKPATTILLVALTLTLAAFTVACASSSKTTAPVAGTVPMVAALNPATANAGDPAFTLTVNGSNFGSKAVVNWNGTAQTSNTTFISSNQLTVAIPASDVAMSGMVTLSATNPGTAGPGMPGCVEQPAQYST